jgi:TatD DNase family protein
VARTRDRGWPAPPEPLPLPVVDNHTHLESVLGWVADGWRRDGDGAPVEQAEPPSLDDHLARAASVGVDRMVQVGCDYESVVLTADLVQAHASLLGAVAIHPNEAVLHAGVREVAPDGLTPDPRFVHEDVPLDEAIARVAAVARSTPRVRAIGETGLDHFRAGPRGREVQREAFRAHVALAKELGLAMQIHDRDAHAEVVEVLLGDGAPERTVFHCFSGDEAMARTAADAGYWLSFAGNITFKNAQNLRDALAVTPPDRILVETDAPFLTPVPLRGRPNAPYLVPLTVRFMAAELDLEVDVLCRQLAANTIAVYGSFD